MAPRLLLAGLGNPGPRYANNRHNVGAMALAAIVRRHRLGPERKRFEGTIAGGRIGDADVLALEPATFMNCSGRSVGAAVRFYKLRAEDVIVFHDELDLAAGKVRVKRGGGVAGHNGLRSIDAQIGQNYRRVRLGIGHPGEKSRVLGHVLTDFTAADDAWLNPLLDALADHAGLLVVGDDAGFMSRVALALRPPKPAPESAPDPAPESASRAPRTGGVGRAADDGRRGGRGGGEG
jgi:PTH1 family peptidyl-tRNA hydrolase